VPPKPTMAIIDANGSACPKIGGVASVLQNLPAFALAHESALGFDGSPNLAQWAARMKTTGRLTSPTASWPSTS
jgi:hypothetical protein